jgi:hypothetical protein
MIKITVVLTVPKAKDMPTVLPWLEQQMDQNYAPDEVATITISYEGA